MADATVVSALNSLLRGEAIEDHDKALRLATTALNASKDKASPEALIAGQTRVVALLKLDRFDDALATLETGGPQLAELCMMERAYALYKTGQLEASDSALRAAKRAAPDEGRQRAIQHLSAQVAFRAERFQTAASIYRRLVQDKEWGRHGEENDMRINLLATHAQLEWQGRGWAVPEAQKQPGREDLEAFETAFNAACACAARAEFAKAAFLLNRAKDLCESSDVLSEDERRAESLSIMIQQVFVSIKQGKLGEAAKLASSFGLSELADRSTKAVAMSNAIVLKADGNPYLALRLLNSAPKVMPARDGLFDHQASMLLRNEFTIKLQAQKFDGVTRAANHALPKKSGPAISADKASLGVFRAAASCRLTTGKEALREILPMLDSYPNDIGLLLTILQLYVQASNPGPAVSLLEAFFDRLQSRSTPDHADVRFAPGLVAVAVGLYRLQGRPAAIRAELAKASAHWRGEGKAKGNGAEQGADAALLREAGIELLRSPNPADFCEAGRAFESLVDADPTDRLAAAGLVASVASTAGDLSRVESHLNMLTPVEALVRGVDVEALLEAGMVSMGSIATLAGKKRAAEDGGTKQSAAKKQKKKKKLPKNVDPNVKPDPERWLPLRDRSSYRPKSKKGKKRAAETMQGGLVREEETLELAGGAGSVKVEKVPVGGSGGKMKKKKGKK